MAFSFNRCLRFQRWCDVKDALEYEPASFVAIETVRAKYACPHCHDGVVEAPGPPQAVEKSLAGEGLLAHVVVSKYVDHLPLHRLEGIFAREGIDLARSTLCGWVADVATALTPIGDQLRHEVTAATYLQTDDTSVTVLDDCAGGAGLLRSLKAFQRVFSGRVSFRVGAMPPLSSPLRFVLVALAGWMNQQQARYHQLSPGGEPLFAARTNRSPTPKWPSGRHFAIRHYGSL